jgi:hypothetical protein
MTRHQPLPAMVCNALGAAGLLVMIAMWWLNISNTYLMLSQSWYMVFRHFLPTLSICLTLAGAIKGERKMWLLATVIAVVSWVLFEASWDM